MFDDRLSAEAAAQLVEMFEAADPYTKKVVFELLKAEESERTDG